MPEIKTAKDNPPQSSPASLQHRINHYESILQSAGEGIIGVDCVGDINFVNPAAANLLDRRDDEMFGQSFHNILFRSSNNNFYNLETCPIHFVLSGGDVMHVNAETFYRPNGTSFLVEYVCLPTRENERTTGAVITFQDITERRDLEAAAARAQKAALEAARLKSAFLANVSHEVRTPLNGVLGMTDLLLETNLSPQQKHYAEMIHHSANALLHIVNDVLDFSKAEAGKVKLEITDFNLREVVNKTIDLFSIEANRKNLSLTGRIDKNVSLSVRGDAGRLQQILNNLIGNALKFTEIGGVTL
ncbi:MAG: PAS domain S-box protein, partial [Pyrinomonadaceae bacterium]|nr:PAS domain S-box protein [Pyrinomonadaceae bacterium]